MRTRLITLITSVLGWWLGRRPAPAIATPRSILIIKPCCLGDVLLTTPLVSVIRSGYPFAQITYAVGRWAGPMVATSQHIDQMLMLPDRWTLGSLLATARTLRSCQFDMVFVPDRSPVLTLLTWLAGIPVRVGLDSAGRGYAYTHRVPVRSLVMHEADQYNQLATAIGLPLPTRRLYFFPTAASDQIAREFLADLRQTAGPVVVIHPGGGQNPGMTLHRKRWLPERWAEIANNLIGRYDANILVIGGPGDEAAVAGVAAGVRGAVATRVQRWDWNVLGALLRQSDLFLGHDTGMMHLAAAVDVPTVAVFGPSDPQVYGPYSDRAIAVWRPTVESPCFYDGVADPDCPCAMQCMRNVTVSDVLATIERVMSSTSIQGAA